MSQREIKEAFVSNLNGTSLQEVVLGSCLAPLCLLSRGLTLILLHQTRANTKTPLHLIYHLFLDFCVLILPLVVSCTILSSVLQQVNISIAVIIVALFCYINYYASAQHPIKTIPSFLQSHVQVQKVPFVTTFRVLVNVKTAISILAVDFSIFPRRYAKTETYGTGVMDVGVGAFVFANGLVCPEARRKNISGSKWSHLMKQLISVWPLFALGMARMASVKMSDYHEHVSEYGVHWNFFFTLAIVKIVASLLLVIVPVNYSWVFAFLISSFYQFTLETSGLKAFLMRNNGRDKDLIHANKEGIFSVVGYVAIYMAGVQVGLHVMQPRSEVREWLRALSKFLFGSCVLYGSLYLCQALIEPVSRRMANFPFCLWSVAQSLFLMSLTGMADLVLLLSTRTSGCQRIPSSWDLCKPKSGGSDQRLDDAERTCLIQAINRNQLLFFLLANVLTGLTNSTVDTLSCSDLLSVCVLLLYMFVNCSLIYVLHISKVTVKFW